MITASAGAVDTRVEAQALADAAVAAASGPSIHHTQPWRLRLTDNELDLYIEYRRGLEVTDLEACLDVLSCGAALHRAVVSLTAGGWHAVPTRLPNRGHPDHLARLCIGHEVRGELGAARQRPTNGLRRASRRADVSTGIDGDILWSITAAVQSTGTRLHLLQPAQVFDLATAADHAQHDASPARSGHYVDLLTSQAHDRAAVVVILYGSENSTLAWLRAGEAFSAAWLTAADLAVSVRPLSAMIEMATTREKARRLLGGLSYPYLVLSLDAMEPGDSAGLHTPRLPTDQTIERL
jgi:hypothetical protein